MQSFELVATDAFIFSGPALEGSDTDNLSWSNLSLHTSGRSSAYTMSRRPSSVMLTRQAQVEEPNEPEAMDIDVRSDLRPCWAADAEEAEPGHVNNIDLLQPVIELVLPYVDSKTLRSLRLCCRMIEHIVDVVQPLRFPAIYRLPHEIIQQVYRYLGPMDYNAARHTCRAWMVASLDLGLLETMLSRGGWFKGARMEIATRPRGDLNRSPAQWFLSKRLARECALMHDWLGNGLRSSPCLSPDGSARTAHALTIRYTADFTELSSADYAPRANMSCSLGFTVSNCARYLLVAEGCVVYVYELSGVHLRPITSVICPRRVLAMSMDTSARRFSLAALLDGRMGLVSDLENEPLFGEALSPQVYIDRSLDHELENRSSPFASHSINGESMSTAPHNNDGLVHGSAAGRSEEASHVNSIHVRSTHQSVTLRNASHETEETAVIQDWPRRFDAPYAQLVSPNVIDSPKCMPRSSAPLSVYHSLCSPDDPPRSVAICPSRRCLAFGCAAGIELHWIDSLSGRNLMKWFPLTAPSDFLYFLPSRRNIDNPHKLRLISSKAGPGQRGGVEHFSRRSLSRRHFALNWSALRHDRVGTGIREADYDHYAALPLSDGAHILFIEPSTGGLFLGCDAPVGGPTKLLRKVSLEPPPNVHCSRDEPPTMYAAGGDLTWGVRVVAVYGDDVVLFTVPPDVFADIKKINGTADAPVHDDGEEYELGSWADWNEPIALTSGNNASTVPTDRSAGVSSPRRPARWPVVVHGAKIGHIPNVVDLAVQSAPDLIVWAVSKSGTASTWIITDGTVKETVHRVVNSEGGVDTIRDEHGDWMMEDRQWQRRARTDSFARPCVPPASIDGHGDVDMDRDDEIAYEIGYAGGQESHSGYTPAPYADRDDDVSMLNASGTDFDRWSANDPLEGPSHGVRRDLDGICEIDIDNRATVDYSACVTTQKPDEYDINMIDVTDDDPFELEVLNDHPVAGVQSLLANMHGLALLPAGSSNTPASPPARRSAHPTFVQQISSAVKSAPSITTISTSMVLQTVIQRETILIR